MTSPAISRLGTDFFVPAFEVRVGGKSVGGRAVRDILSVTYRDALESIDTFQLVVNNWDEEKRDFKYSEGDLFAPGQEVELKLGYRDEPLVDVLFGEITSLTPQFPASGVPTIAVGGSSILHRLRREQRDAVYKKKKDSEIAQAIIKGVGLKPKTPDIGKEKTNDHVPQHSEYDLIFLLKRAKRRGYELSVDEDNGQHVIRFGTPKGSVGVPFKLTWGGSLLSFNLKLNVVNQVGKVIVRGADPKSKGKIEATEQRPGGDPFHDAFKDRKEVISDRPPKDLADAKARAETAMTRIRQDYITATGSTVGLPELRTGTLVDIDGVGERFSGKYFITSTTHTLGDGGYQTSFDARKELA